MFVILTSLYDKVVRTIIRQCKVHEIAILTCKDLSVSGWNLSLENIEQSTAIIQDKRIKLNEITGVWNRLPFVTEHELDHILLTERKYVASEMMAFLVSWLSCLNCPMINMPTPTCLSGPNWHQLQWAYTAIRADISIYPPSYYTFNNNSILQQNNKEGITTVTIVGRRSFGSEDKELIQKTKYLANNAGTDLLSVMFYISKHHIFFVNANSSPYNINEDIFNAIIKYLEEGKRGVI